DVAVMRQSYQVSARGDCTGGKTKQASRPAAAWLSDVKDLAGEQDFFVTPYADVDMAAMAHHGLVSELTDAFNDGRLATQQLLGPPQRSTPATPGSPPTTLGVIAWPAGGVADYGVLEELAVQQHVQVMIMDSKLMPSIPQVSYTPTAVTTIPHPSPRLMHVLLSDHALT